MSRVGATVIIIQEVAQFLNLLPQTPLVIVRTKASGLAVDGLQVVVI